ncbi:hypothetical protein L596_026613 [Steinernema carpocapsae]|uniref:G-protein coupled receptors family 1 profile domain-containing protein n=1 Tax=Steinernema carpocapsae TaxID=34508 RepID=A0A4U5M1W1_STECR|nr:hypothetical protein L596_026613 [Steinernema carpocapsae]
MSHPFYLYFAWNEIYVSFYTCSHINFIFVSCADFSSCMMFFISLDRLICFKKPLFYKSLNSNYYVGGVVAICLFYCGFMKAMISISLTEEKTICLIAESMTGTMSLVWSGASTLLNLAVILVYSFLIKNFKASGSEYKKINRSLKTMITVHIFGWFLTMSVVSISYLAAPTHRVYIAMTTTGGIGANLNLAAPFFIYYFRSSLYREAFDKLFRRMELFCVKSQVQPSSYAIATNRQEPTVQLVVIVLNAKTIGGYIKPNVKSDVIVLL